MQSGPSITTVERMDFPVMEGETEVQRGMGFAQGHTVSKGRAGIEVWSLDSQNRDLFTAPQPLPCH